MAAPLITDRRRRRKQQHKQVQPPEATPAAEECKPSPPRSWADLEVGLLTQIAKSMGEISDYSRFARVCRSWRKAAIPEERGRRQWAQFPGLLIANRPREKIQGDRFLPAGRIGRYLIGKKKEPYKLLRVVLQPAAAEEWDCRGTHEGWVVMVKPCNVVHDAINVTLRNPLTDVDDIPLPPLLHPAANGSNTPTTTTASSSWLVEKAVLSSSPASGRRCYVLMFYQLRVTEFHNVRLVALCEVREGEGRWRHVEFTEVPVDHEDYIDPSTAAATASSLDGTPPALKDTDAIYIPAKSNFYILNRGILHSLDPSATTLKTTVLSRIEGKLPMKQTKWRPSLDLNFYFHSDEAGCSVAPHFHVAELGGELVVLVRLVGYARGKGEAGFRNFVVYTWRRSEDRQGYYWEEASDLGGAALFVGTCQASFSLTPGVDVAAAARVQRDHIYFALVSHVHVAGTPEIGDYNYLYNCNNDPTTTDHSSTTSSDGDHEDVTSCGAVRLFEFAPAVLGGYELRYGFPHLRRPRPFWFLPMLWRSSSSCIDEKGDDEDQDESNSSENDDDDDGFAANVTNRFESLLAL